MHRLKFVFFILVGAVLAPACSSAADLPLKAPPLAGYGWSGIYAGINFGGGWADADWTNTANDQVLGGFGDSVPFDFFSNRLSGLIAGGQIGFNWQSGPLVLGVEALGDWSGIVGNHTSTFGAADDQFSARVKALLQLTGRVGYAWNNWLLYGKAGYGVADIAISVDDTTGPTTGSGADRQWRGGAVVGLGIEYGLTRNLSIGIEASRQYLDSGSYELGDATGSYRWDVDVHRLDAVMAKLNYRFR